MLKISFLKTKSFEINCRSYTHFDGDSFKKDVKTALSNNVTQICEDFEKIVLNMLDHHAPLKRKVLRASNAPYSTKQLRWRTMRRSQLEKTSLKALTNKSLKSYEK